MDILDIISIWSPFSDVEIIEIFESGIFVPIIIELGEEDASNQ